MCMVFKDSGKCNINKAVCQCVQMIIPNCRAYKRSVVLIMASYSLQSTALAAVLIIARTAAHDVLSFPKDFLLGTATSAYQIEGAWNEGGKGENVWDHWTHEHPEIIRDHSNGNIACDSFHKYKEDVKLLKSIGVDFYRFSLSWSRILPNGYTNVVNQDGLNYYKNLINELAANNIEPFITLYHWDQPEIFEKMGGWTNEMMVEWISDYARFIFKELGPKVKYFVTINEPSIICSEGYMSNMKAPGKNLGAPAKFLCMHNILKAHAKIYHIYDTEFRKQQGGLIGLVMPCGGIYPKTPNETAAIEPYFQFECGWIANPIFSATGDYPEIVKAHVAENSKVDGFPRSILPEFSPEWVQYIKGTSDFFGLNHYTSRLVETVPRAKGELWYYYSGVKASVDPSWPSTDSDWLKVVPDGFRMILNKITAEYDHPPIYVLENGVSANADVDDKRTLYLYSYMKAMLAAIHKDGCNVKAYTAWSLLDNFEWDKGYTEKFGLVKIDFADPNRTRTPRMSMGWYTKVVKTRELQLNAEYPTVLRIP